MHGPAPMAAIDHPHRYRRDIDGLRVPHALPVKGTDEREFAAFLVLAEVAVRADGTLALAEGNHEAMAVRYTGEGAYTVQVSTKRLIGALFQPRSTDVWAHPTPPPATRPWQR